VENDVDTGRWKEHVTFEILRPERYRTITNTAEAARALIDEWPIKTGKELKRAEAACLAVLVGNGDPDEARTAFLKAAREADVFVKPIKPE
jgi:hypothetical protein